MIEDFKEKRIITIYTSCSHKRQLGTCEMLASHEVKIVSFGAAWATSQGHHLCTTGSFSNWWSSWSPCSGGWSTSDGNGKCCALRRWGLEGYPWIIVCVPSEGTMRRWPGLCLLAFWLMCKPVSPCSSRVVTALPVAQSNSLPGHDWNPRTLSPRNLHFQKCGWHHGRNLANRNKRISLKLFLT